MRRISDATLVGQLTPQHLTFEAGRVASGCVFGGFEGSPNDEHPLDVVHFDDKLSQLEMAVVLHRRTESMAMRGQRAPWASS